MTEIQKDRIRNLDDDRKNALIFSLFDLNLNFQSVQNQRYDRVFTKTMHEDYIEVLLLGVEEEY